MARSEKDKLSKDKLSSRSMTDDSLVRLCGYITELVCVLYESPYIREEVFDVALVTAHIARAEGLTKSLLILKVKHRAKNELYRLIGYHPEKRKKKPAREGESQYGCKLETLLTEGLTVPGSAQGDYDIENPRLPRQPCAYERLDNSDLVEYLLSRLDERSRSFVELYYLHGCSSNEISQMYGIKNHCSVQKAINRSLHRLREMPEFEGVAL